MTLVPLLSPSGSWLLAGLYVKPAATPLCTWKLVLAVFLANLIATVHCPSALVVHEVVLPSVHEPLTTTFPTTVWRVVTVIDGRGQAFP
jgi:hypothetical protein